MEPIKLKVAFVDGTEKEISTVAADLIAFETRFDMSISALEKNVRMTHLFFIAYSALKRTGDATEEFEKWVESVGMVSIGEAKK
jgi:hypothetical protein